MADLAARVRQLEEALRPFVNVRDQFPQSMKLINPKLDALTAVNVTVTKGQFLAAAKLISPLTLDDGI